MWPSGHQEFDYSIKNESFAYRIVIKLSSNNTKRQEEITQLSSWLRAKVKRQNYRYLGAGEWGFISQDDAIWFNLTWNHT